MEKSLLQKIKKIEREADERIAQVHNERRSQVLGVKNSEANMLDDVRERVKVKGRAIIEAHVKQAMAEVNEMKQEQGRTVEAVHERATTNSKRAVMKIEEMFKDNYLKV